VANVGIFHASVVTRASRGLSTGRMRVADYPGALELRRAVPRHTLDACAVPHQEYRDAPG
jgi:hypothetical protein